MNSALPLAAAPRSVTTEFEVGTARSFDDLLGQRDSLLPGQTESDLFQTWGWFDNLLRHGTDTQAQAVLLLVRDKRAGSSFCLPLLRRPRAGAAPFGAVCTSLSNFYSSLYGPIGDARQLTLAGLRAAFAHLRRHHGASRVIDLQPLDTGSRFFSLAQEALHAEGYRTDTYFCFGNWYLQVAGRSYESYEPSIPSRLRNTIKRGRKKLDAAGNWSLAVHTHSGPALEQAIRDFEAIYAKSWKVPEPFPGFVPGLCRMAAAQGWLRLGVLHVDGAPAAAQLWLVKDGHALIYKLAYDEDFKRYSAGSVLSAELMRRALDEDRVLEVDYLTGDDGYKVDWMSHRRERHGIVAFRPWTLQGGIALLRHRAGRWWRSRRQAAAPVAPAAPAAAQDGEA